MIAILIGALFISLTDIPGPSIIVGTDAGQPAAELLVWWWLVMQGISFLITLELLVFGHLHVDRGFGNRSNAVG
jgi:hypothetical protein